MFTSRSRGQLFRAARPLIAAALCAPFATPFADSFTLAVQPVLTPDLTREAYAPLAEYLSARTGHDIRIETSRDFYSYWTRINREEFDFVLDAAHFTGYRAKNMNYQVLAAVPDTVSYSLVSGGDNLIFSPDELVGRPVATMGPPSLGAIRLEQLYDNPMREPLFRTAGTASEAIDMVRDGRAVAAMVPTPMVAQFADLNTIQVSAATPHIAVSAAPHVPQEVRVAIQGLLARMSKDEAGNQVLTTIRLAGFELASETRYLPYAELIESSRAQLNPTGATAPKRITKHLALASPAE